MKLESSQKLNQKLSFDQTGIPGKNLENPVHGKCARNTINTMKTRKSRKPMQPIERKKQKKKRGNNLEEKCLKIIKYKKKKQEN